MPPRDGSAMSSMAAAIARAGSVAIAAAVILTARALAAQEELPVGLRYEADPGCPDRGTFVAQVRARTPTVSFVNVAVTAHAGPAGASGTVRTGAAPVRHVSGESCADVVAALALILALSIDPMAAAGTGQRLASTTSPASPSSTPAPSPSGEPAESESSRANAAPSRVSRRWFGSAGVRFEASAGVESQTLSLFGASVGMEAGARLAAPFDPSVRLSGRFLASPTVFAAPGSAHFHLLAARLDASPLRLEKGRAAVIPYLFIEVGSLTGIADRIAPVLSPADRSKPWLCVGQSLALVLEVAHPVYVTISAELREPLDRYHFVFVGPRGDLAVADVRGFEIGGAVGGAVRFW